jgi:hypothetical protein
MVNSTKDLSVDGKNQLIHENEPPVDEEIPREDFTHQNDEKDTLLAKDSNMSKRTDEKNDSKLEIGDL